MTYQAWYTNVLIHQLFLTCVKQRNICRNTGHILRFETILIVWTMWRRVLQKSMRFNMLSMFALVCLRIYKKIREDYRSAKIFQSKNVYDFYVRGKKELNRKEVSSYTYVYRNIKKQLKYKYIINIWYWFQVQIVLFLSFFFISCGL